MVSRWTMAAAPLTVPCEVVLSCFQCCQFISFDHNNVQLVYGTMKTRSSAISVRENGEYYISNGSIGHWVREFMQDVLQLATQQQPAAAFQPIATAPGQAQNPHLPAVPSPAQARHELTAKIDTF